MWPKGMEMKHLGFTGTRQSLPQAQVITLYGVLGGYYNLLNSYHEATLHHGDCHGGDTAAHYLASLLGYRLSIHPPDKDKHRAYLVGDTVFDTAPYLDRNKSIVDCSQVLVACPRTEEEELRSGTWSTIRYARKEGKPRVIIYPDGRRIIEDG